MDATCKNNGLTSHDLRQWVGVTMDVTRTMAPSMTKQLEGVTMMPSQEQWI